MTDDRTTTATRIPSAGTAPEARPGVVWIWGPAVMGMAGIFFASSLPNLTSLPGDVSDKTAHFVGYGVLGALVLRATARARWSGVTWSTALPAWLLCLAYGASDEIHQWFVPGRTAALDDWIADATGAAAAILVLTIVAAVLRRRSRAI